MRKRVLCIDSIHDQETLEACESIPLFAKSRTRSCERSKIQAAIYEEVVAFASVSYECLEAQNAGAC